MIKGNPTLSIITPTYNRAHLLTRCYESLLNQTNYDFEWILVDDGSEDNTEEVANKFGGADIPFEVIFVSKENGGKHTALNASHPYIHGKFVLLLDSDDILTNDAVDIVLTGWKKYENESEIAMVAYTRQNSNGELCAYAKDEYVPTDVLHYKRVCVASSDCCEVIRTELFLKYPFPVFENERFLAETALWYRAGLDGKCVYINKVIYICEYLEGGLTQSGRMMRIKNCNGGMYTSYLRMNKRCFLSERVRAGMLYVCYGKFANKTTVELLSKAKPYEVLTVICILPGTIMYNLWKKKYLK